MPARVSRHVRKAIDMIRSDLKNIVLMKFGTHGNESSKSILSRKHEELLDSGFVFWGYNGVLCHPLNQINPFVAANQEKGEKTFLVLCKTIQEKKSSDCIDSIEMHRAQLFSLDKKIWEPIPKGVNVTNSKYAVICSSFEDCDFDIDISQYILPFANPKNCRMSNYLGWRKNKACGLYSPSELEIIPAKLSHISVIAEIKYAAFLSF